MSVRAGAGGDEMTETTESVRKARYQHLHLGLGADERLAWQG